MLTNHGMVTKMQPKTPLERMIDWLEETIADYGDPTMYDAVDMLIVATLQDSLDKALYLNDFYG